METRTMPATALTAAVAFPKTGKRGVPQQFPRRLYEMLEMESARQEQQQHSIVTGGCGTAQPEPSLLLAAAPTAATRDRDPLITWSPTGRAFHISDSKLFAEQVLPSYFRTSKFSSFQRNLNLYGFSKVRRGPDIGMYAHPSFQRGKPENLVQLRKLTTAADRQRAADKLAECVAAQSQEAEGQPPRATNQAMIGTGAIATVAPPTYDYAPPPKRSVSRSVSVTSTDYFSSSSFSTACFDASTTTSECSDDSTANVATAYNGISISDLIQTYQKSVDARPVSSSSSVASSFVEVATTTTTAENAEHHSSEHTPTSKTTTPPHKVGHSADSLEDNKLALLAFAMTSMAGQVVPWCHKKRSGSSFRW